ncbi:hypothetical protein [Clostridium sp.]|uniref:hypothetical protein n=1 Tax=Clostridium sp. TaxID=1506 RepID=UPI002FCA81ED
MMNNKEYKQMVFENWYIEKFDNEQDTNALEYITEHMIRKFISIFGRDIMLKEDCYIYLDKQASCPMLVLNHEVLKIRLTSEKTSYWSQIIYQLSHEMCHYAMRQGSDDKETISWFEETMCEAMSLYFLDYFAKTWTSCKLSKNDKGYSKSIKSYLDNILGKYKEKSILEKCANFLQLENIEKTCTDSRDFRAEDRDKIYYLFKKHSKKIYMITDYKKYKVNKIGIDFELWLKNKRNDRFIKGLNGLVPNMKFNQEGKLIV